MRHATTLALLAGLIAAALDARPAPPIPSTPAGLALDAPPDFAAIDGQAADRVDFMLIGDQAAGHPSTPTPPPAPPTGPAAPTPPPHANPGQVDTATGPAADPGNPSTPAGQAAPPANACPGGQCPTTPTPYFPALRRRFR